MVELTDTSKVEIQQLLAIPCLNINTPEEKVSNPYNAFILFTITVSLLPI